MRYRAALVLMVASSVPVRASGQDVEVALKVGAYYPRSILTDSATYAEENSPLDGGYRGSHENGFVIGAELVAWNWGPLGIAASISHAVTRFNGESWNDLHPEPRHTEAAASVTIMSVRPVLRVAGSFAGLELSAGPLLAVVAGEAHRGRGASGFGGGGGAVMLLSPGGATSFGVGVDMSIYSPLSTWDVQKDVLLVGVFRVSLSELRRKAGNGATTHNMGWPVAAPSAPHPPFKARSADLDGEG